MIRELNARENKGFEVQWYKKNGSYGKVVQCDTVLELAQYLSRCLWGSTVGFESNPTVWYNGEKWCFGEYTPI